MEEFRVGTNQYKFLNDIFSKIASLLNSDEANPQAVLEYLKTIFVSHREYFFLIFRNQPKQNFNDGYELLIKICDLAKNEKVKDKESIANVEIFKEIFFEIYSFKGQEDPNQKIIEYFSTLSEDKQKDLFRLFKPIFMASGPQNFFYEGFTSTYINDIEIFKLFLNDEKPSNEFKGGHELLSKICNSDKDIKHIQSSERSSLKKIFFKIYSFKDEKDPNRKIIEYFWVLPKNEQKYFFQFFKSIFLTTGINDLCQKVIAFFASSIEYNSRDFFILIRDFLVAYSLRESFKQGQELLLKICDSVSDTDNEIPYLLLEKVFLEIYSFRDELDSNNKIIEYFWTLSNDEQKWFFKYFKSIFISYGLEKAHNKYSILSHTCNLLENVQFSSSNFDFLIRIYQTLYSLNGEYDSSHKFIQDLDKLPVNGFFEFFEKFIKSLPVNEN